MADQRIIYTEEMVGASHPTKVDTLNRLALVEHENDGTHQKAISHLTASLPLWTDASKKLISRALADARQDLATPSKCTIYMAGAQSLTKETWCKIALDQEAYDVNGEFDAVTNRRFTAKEAGWYGVKANIVIETLEAVAVLSSIYVNGVAIATTRNRANASSYVSLQVQKDVYLAVDHYIELFGYHGSSVDKNCSGGVDTTYLSIHQLSKG